MKLQPKPLSKKRFLRYSPHLVTYIDILGFGELVQQNDPNFISRAIRQVQELTIPNVHTNKYKNDHYVNFSDLIVHTIPLDEQDQNLESVVANELKYTALVQAALIEKRILLRGAIAIGNIERSYNVLFGPGLISAYELERDHAIFSRIVISDEVLDAIQTKTSKEMLSNCIRADDDGSTFIDYLGFSYEALGNQQTSYERLLELHRKIIEKNLAVFEGIKKVRSKYLWLKKYHNAVVRRTVDGKAQKQFVVVGPTSNSWIPPLTLS